MRTSKPHALRYIWLVSALLIILLVLHKAILLAFGAFLIIQDDLQPADLIHVLGGGYDRLNYAVTLYQQDYAAKLFVTGDDDAITYKKYLVRHGVPDDVIQPDRSWATSTYEEALELKHFLDGQSAIRSVIIISAPYHMRRVRWVFNKVVENQVQLRFVPVPFEMSLHKRQWWKHSRSIKMVKSEYLKLPFYILRYYFSSVWSRH